MLRINDCSIVINLTLHGIGKSNRKLEVGEKDVWLSVQVFDDIMNLISNRENIVLTIDDGNCSDADIILPSLLKHNMKAIFFLSAGMIGSPGYLSQDGVSNLVKSGMTIGTHGMFHSKWRDLSDSELSEELLTSKERLEDMTEQLVLQAACPGGDYNRRVLKHLQKASFERVYSSDPGVAKAGDWFQARNTLRRGSTIESLKRIIEPPRFSSKTLVQKIKTCVKKMR